MENTRLIILEDGTTMGDNSYVFETNAPKERLASLLEECNQLYINEPDPEIPIWSEVLENEGYIFKYKDEHQHVTAYGTSKSWKENKYDFIKEVYTIENQPDV